MGFVTVVDTLIVVGVHALRIILLLLQLIHYLSLYCDDA